MNIRNERSSPAGTESPYVAFHQQDWIPEFYDEVVYQPGGYDDHSWRMLQRPMLERVVAAMPQRQIRCLDFACGTGRILSAVEPLVAKIVGIDTSEQMLSKARARGTSARLFCTDILIDESAAREKYDLITAYRFFLNTEPELRARVMEKLASMLDGPDARLVFNVHGHVPSSISLTSLHRRLHGWPPVNSMSIGEIRKLIGDAGLEAVEWRGFGLFPNRLYRSWLAGACKWFDRVAARIKWAHLLSLDVVTVCKLRQGA